MSTFLTYNDKIIASGQPVPILGKSQEMIRYGERWAERTTITLQGQLTGCTYRSLLTAQSGLINDFSQDFHDFKVVEQGQTIFDLPMAQIRSVNFTESKYVGLLGYTVTIEGFEQNLFSGIYGVLDPNDSWTFEEAKDGIVKINHEVSAKGFNTQGPYSNAFENAKAFVLARSGWNEQAVPTFVSGLSPCLISFGERIGRFEGNYSISEQYQYDPYSSGGCNSLRYSTEYDCSLVEGRTSVTVRGAIQGGFDSTISDLKNQYLTFNCFSAAQSADLSNSVTNNYSSKSVTEDVYAKKLTFQLVYDNLPYDANGIAFDYGIQIDTDDDDLTKVNVNGTVRGRGDIGTRWTNVQNYVNQIDLYGAAVSGYDAAIPYYQTIPLNPFPLSSGNSYNQFSAEIGINASFDNRPTPSDSNFSEISYSQSANIALQQVGNIPLLQDCNVGKQYYITDLGYKNRAEFTMEGTARPICTKTPAEVLEALKIWIDGVRQTEANGSRMVLIKQEFTTSNTTAGSDIKFACGWTFEHSGATSPGNYAQISSLSVS